MMRKGLWSPDEDERLVRCITKYVNGSWSDIARKAGLDRCGKSCRRRWMNHLRPDLKRGKFSMEEINLIVQLQEALGNRWSDIASHLDGRTDNDVKNLWNTQIKKRLSQIKANQSSNSSTASCVPMITFSDTTNNNNTNTHAAVSYSCTNSNIHQQQLKVINNNINDPANLEFLHSFDDLQAHGNLVVRFNGSINGMDHNSCSASSCEGSDHQLNNFNDHAISSWKPNVLSVPAEYILNPPAHSPDSIHLFWSTIQETDHPNAAAQFAPNTELTTRADHSLLNMSCHSSNNLVSMMIPSLQSPTQVPCPLLCASDHQTPAAATTAPTPCTGILFDLCHENHGDCTTTMASLESSSYVVVKADSCVGAAPNDDSEECCSLQHQCLMGSMDHASSLHDQMVTETDQSLQQHNFYCSPNMNEVEVGAVIMNNTVCKDTDNSDVITGKEAAAAKLVPAAGINNDDDQSNMWEGPNNDELQPQLQSSSNMQVQQASAGAANIGWDMTSDQCSGLPHFAFPDWCKHLLQSEYLL